MASNLRDQIWLANSNCQRIQGTAVRYNFWFLHTKGKEKVWQNKACFVYVISAHRTVSFLYWPFLPNRRVVNLLRNAVYILFGCVCVKRIKLEFCPKFVISFRCKSNTVRGFLMAVYLVAYHFWHVSVSNKLFLENVIQSLQLTVL